MLLPFSAAPLPAESAVAVTVPFVLLWKNKQSTQLNITMLYATFKKHINLDFIEEKSLAFSCSVYK